MFAEATFELGILLRSIGRYLGVIRLFPDWAIAPGFGFRQMQRIRVSEALASDPVLDAAPRGKLLVEVPLGACLCREFRLPASVGRKASEVAEVELRQTLPLLGRGLIWRLSPARRDGDALVIQAFVLKTAHVRAIAVKLGPRLAQLRLEGRSDIAPFIDDRRDFLRGARLWALAAMATPLIVLGPDLWAEWQSLKVLQLQIADTKEEVQTLGERAVVMRSDQAQAEATKQGQSQDRITLEAARGRAWMLAELTLVVEDDVWISELVLAGSEMRLVGYAARDVTKLIETLQALEWITRARLDGPVMNDGASDGVRFDVLVDLNVPENMD
jgi:hypothetical protein